MRGRAVIEHVCVVFLVWLQEGRQNRNDGGKLMNERRKMSGLRLTIGGGGCGRIREGETVVDEGDPSPVRALLEPLKFLFLGWTTLKLVLPRPSNQTLPFPACCLLDDISETLVAVDC
jgi:hypothetical protein